MNKVDTPPDSILQRTRFLIVEKSTAEADVIERYLLLGNALHVRKARTALLALRILQDPRTPVDCVICANDLEPPTGVEFLKNIRAGRYGGKSLSEIKFILTLRDGNMAVIQSAAPSRPSAIIIGEKDRDEFTAAVVSALKQPQIPTASNVTVTPLPADGTPVAHIREQGVDLIIVPLDSRFADQAQDEQLRAIDKLRESARQARMGGEVVPVWDTGNGGMGFIAPKGFHPYFRSITFKFVQANLNSALPTSS